MVQFLMHKKIFKTMTNYVLTLKILGNPHQCYLSNPEKI